MTRALRTLFLLSGLVARFSCWVKAMKAVLLAMTEDEHDKRSWRCSGMVLAMILLTLALNVSTREQAALLRQAYNDSNNTILLLFTSAAVAGQLLTAALLMSSETVRGDWPDKEAMSILLLSHVGTTFLHDYLISLGGAHIHLPVTLFHPLLVLSVLWLVTSTAARPLLWISTAVIGAGCTLMSVRLSAVMGSGSSWLPCVLSMVALTVRNIVLRQLAGIEHVAFRPRRKRVISSLALAAVLFLVAVKCFTSSIWLLPALYAVITCALSALLVYVTTQVLKSYTVPWVSLFCVWPVLAEALLMTPADQRPGFLVINLCLVIAVLGHYLFVRAHLDPAVDATGCSLTSTYPPKQGSTHEQYTRMEFLLFAGLVLGVIFSVFQPQFSQRDLDTLSYVGLDKVIRRLLMLDIKEQVHVVEQLGQVQLP